MITVDDTVHEVEKDIAKAGGFTDHDGDGNELVDDAIVVAEEQTKEQVSEMSDMIDKAASIMEDGKAGITGAAAAAGGALLAGASGLGDTVKGALEEGKDLLGDATSEEE